MLQPPAVLLELENACSAVLGASELVIRILAALAQLTEGAADALWMEMAVASRAEIQLMAGRLRHGQAAP
eukprot:scaffold172786_cov19-Prasinocladus_malaysianus.AAC.1